MRGWPGPRWGEGAGAPDLSGPHGPARNVGRGHRSAEADPRVRGEVAPHGLPVPLTYEPAERGYRTRVPEAAVAAVAGRSRPARLPEGAQPQKGSGARGSPGRLARHLWTPSRSRPRAARRAVYKTTATAIELQSSRGERTQDLQHQRIRTT